jgi:NTP pyrophosphatase (non-canonical NTP hydrolase)
MNEVQKLSGHIIAWVKQTFPDQPLIGVAKHLEKETKELSDEISNQNHQNAIKELVDCFMLLLEISQFLCVPIARLVELTYLKLEENKTRKWGEPSSDGAIEHIKTPGKEISNEQL